MGIHRINQKQDGRQECEPGRPAQLTQDSVDESHRAAKHEEVDQVIACERMPADGGREDVWHEYPEARDELVLDL